jgi:bifunctional DNA-binding transcriptional regulator/antitoxin component of YhaV-PrlF toxin-antitoxin module
MKTAGYSGTPLHKKLGLKPGQRVWFSGAPRGYQAEIQKAGSFEVEKTLGAEMDFLHLFAGDLSSLKRDLPKLRDAMKRTGILWISWPKKSSGVATDLDENLVRDIGLKSGLVDVKVCAVDETWSGLKFVYRLKDR